MSCSYHTDRPATDSCRVCGRALCDECATPNGSVDGPCCPFCDATATAEAGSTPPPARSSSSARLRTVGGRHPALAAAASALLPGLGQLLNREPVKGLSMLAAIILLTIGADFDPRLAVFAVCGYIYSIIEAYARAAGSAPERPTSGLWSWGLVAIGSVLLLETTLDILPGPQVLVPALLISAGLRLLYIYFRGSPEVTS